MNLLATPNRRSPAIIGHQLGDDDLQAGVGPAAPNGLAQPDLAHWGSDSGAHRTPIAQQRRDELHAHVARPAGDQNRAHRSTSSTAK